MSRMDNALYEQQCHRWHNELLTDFESNNTYNLNERLDEMEKIVNRECSEYSFLGCDFPFIIGSSQRQNLQTLCNKDIREHTRVNSTKCMTQMNVIDDYKKKARNKLNRWKPKIFGEHVLYKIIFINVYNHCCTIGRSASFQWNDDMINRLFVTIFMELLDAKIRFKKTRDVPLILATAFSTNTRFRSSCVHFLQHFNELTAWNQKSGTAKDRRNSFRRCLDTIKRCDHTAIPPPIIPDIMHITAMNRDCDVIYFDIIRQWIIQLEDEEYMYSDERISHDRIYIELVCQYHHNTLQFWTVTATKPATPPPQEESIFMEAECEIVSPPDIHMNCAPQPPVSYDHCRGSPHYRHAAHVQFTTPSLADSQAMSIGPMSVISRGNSAPGYEYDPNHTPFTSERVPNRQPPHNHTRSEYMYRQQRQPPPPRTTTHSYADSSESSTVFSQIGYIPQLSDNNGSNLYPVPSHEEMEWNDAVMYNGNPHITEQLPPPPSHYAEDPHATNYGHHPHISRQLPPPPVHLERPYAHECITGTNHHHHTVYNSYNNHNNPHNVAYNPRMNMAHGNINTNYDYMRMQSGCHCGCHHHNRYPPQAQMEVDSQPNVAYHPNPMRYNNDYRNRQQQTPL